MDSHRRNLYRFAMLCDRLYRLRLHLGSWRTRNQHCIRRDMRSVNAAREEIRVLLCQDGRIDADVDAIRRRGRIYNR